ncbi:hypothetical protein [Breoghania sp.]|uniref:hypothetical protein n=1 Tax=Breoghania sp. TaxID=2065378 RepID=UPI002AA74054|nr:hypothetical protein [Breoghania sp.]
MVMVTMRPSLTLVDQTSEVPEDDTGLEEYEMNAMDASLHGRLRAMRQMLDNAPQATAAEALAMLRQAFPDANLSDRLRALGYREEM